MVLSACEALCTRRNPAHAPQRLKRSIRAHMKHADPAVAIVKAVQETTVATFGHIHRMTAIPSHSRPAVGEGESCSFDAKSGFQRAVVPLPRGVEAAEACLPSFQNSFIRFVDQIIPTQCLRKGIRLDGAETKVQMTPPPFGVFEPLRHPP